MRAQEEWSLKEAELLHVCPCSSGQVPTNNVKVHVPGVIESSCDLSKMDETLYAHIKPLFSTLLCRVLSYTYKLALTP